MPRRRASSAASWVISASRSTQTVQLEGQAASWRPLITWPLRRRSAGPAGLAAAGRLFSPAGEKLLASAPTRTEECVTVPKTFE